MNMRNLTKRYRQSRTPHTLNRIQLRTVNGQQHKNDKVLQINTNGRWINITFIDLLRMVKHLYTNEDIIHPKPYESGSNYVLEALRFLHTHTLEETVNRYGHKKRV